ncbi:MAG: hypothetical protein J6Y28_06395 [Acholeplasmatales bacterium]|nr:hypothetical protein [Acholeplasmatales bacterium]
MENNSFERDVQREKIHIHSMPFIWLFSIIGAVVFFFINKKWCFDYVLGVVAGLFGLTMMLYAVNTTKIENLKSRMVINYFIRYIMYAIIFAFVYVTDGANYLWTTLVGIMVVKVVLVCYALIMKGKKV